MEQQHIIVVDDDVEICKSVAAFLSQHSYRVTTLQESSKALTLIQTDPPHLLIVDMMMPELDGVQLSQQVRASTNVPILMLTAVRDDLDRVMALDAGVDDYLTKPFNLRVLLAQVRAILRPKGQREQVVQVAEELYCFNGWVLNVGTHALTAPDGVVVVLSFGEYNLLLTLLEHPNRVLSRDFLLDATSADADTFDRSIDVFISRLRQKIEQNSKEPQLIKTIRNGGYMFCAEVTRAT